MSPGTRDQHKARLLAAAQAAPSPTRAQVERQGRVSMFLAIVAVLLVFVAIGGVKVGSRPASLIMVSGAVWTLVAAAATALALRRGRSMLGVPRGWLLATGLAVAPVLALSWLCMPGQTSLALGPHAYLPDAICFAVTLALAAGPLLVFVRMRSEGDPVHPVMTGAALGAAAGAWGATLIDLHCERADTLHVLLGHVAPVVVLAFIGAVWARSALR